jgi:hypothetical protein
MTKLEAILKEADSLSAGERAHLVAVLLQQAGGDGQADDVAVGQRGLAAWTESARHEDWSALYPDALKTSRDST